MRYQAILASSLLVLSACAKVPEKAPAPEMPAAPVFEEIEADGVSFVRMHPGAAQKNVYASWKHYKKEDGTTTWRSRQEELSDDAKARLGALFESARKNLIPSNGLFACRYREDMPQYRLNFRHDGKSYAIVSASNCLHGAPWNVIEDGRPYVQLTGEIGSALENLLRATDAEMKIGDTPGMIMLGETVQIAEYQADGDRTPASWFDAEFRKDASFGGAVQYIENLFGPLGDPEIACNQAKSADCSDVSARYTLKIGQHYEYPIVLRYDAGTVAATIPPQTAFELLSGASKTAVFKSWPSAAQRKEPIRVSWENPEECRMVRGLAKHFGLPDDASCGMWKMTSESFPSAIYYTGLESIWIEPDHDYKAYFEAVWQNQTDKKAKKISYSDFMRPGKSTNLFIRLDGRPIAFVTEDGKTTIRQ